MNFHPGDGTWRSQIGYNSAEFLSQDFSLLLGNHSRERAVPGTLGGEEGDKCCSHTSLHDGTGHYFKEWLPGQGCGFG